jgi:predicted TIM-barrel fold metal-dependent hydrolase
VARLSIKLEKKAGAFGLLCGVIGLVLAAPIWLAGQTAQQSVAAASSFIDGHVHLDQHDANGFESMLESLSHENARKVFILVPPYTFDDPARYEADVLFPFAKKHPDKLAVIAGGGSLNAMLQQSVASGDAGAEAQRKFKERAEGLLRDGAVGFGEMTTEHFPSPGSATYQYAPADHPLLLLLADIAAQHGVPIVFHIEAVPQDMPLPSGLKSPPNPPRLHANIAALERLLAHNPRAKIIWAHAGSDNTAYRTPDLCRRLLQAHANLYMEIKMDPVSPGLNPPLVDGKLKPDWLKLFADFPGRFFIGSDEHYPESTGPQRWQAAVMLLNQLPAGLRAKIGTQNVLRIYNSKLD